MFMVLVRLSETWALSSGFIICNSADTDSDRQKRLNAWFSSISYAVVELPCPGSCHAGSVGMVAH